MRVKNSTWKAGLIIIAVLIIICGCRKTANSNINENDGATNDTTSIEFDADTVLVDGESFSDGSADIEMAFPSAETGATADPQTVTDETSPQPFDANNSAGANNSFAATSQPSNTPNGSSGTTATPSPSTENTPESEATGAPWDNFDQGEWDDDD